MQSMLALRAYCLHVGRLRSWPSVGCWASHHPTLGFRLTAHRVRLAAEPVVSQASMQPFIGSERASQGCLRACTIRGSCAANQASTPGLFVSVVA